MKTFARLLRPSAVSSCAPLMTALVLFSSVAVAKVRFDVRVPMRDGVALSGDLWLPDEPGQKYPVLLMRTPYLKTETEWLKAGEWGELFTSHGYALMVQDVRGRGDSDGVFDYYFQEGADGADTINWLAAQPWSDGRVGTLGPSYLGTVQWLTARERPAPLKCIAATSPMGRIFDEDPYVGGAFRLDWALSWVNRTSARSAQLESEQMGVDLQEIYAHRPLLTMDEAYGRTMPLYRNFLKHPTLDDYWRRIQFADEDFRKIELPVLHITGWFDADQLGALFFWNGMARVSKAKSQQYLIVGPWNHRQTAVGGKTSMGEMQFSEDSVVDFRRLHLAFFDSCLKGKTARPDLPQVRLYFTGENRWRSFGEYPPAVARVQQLYLTSAGNANTLSGDGHLAWQRPRASAPDKFTYDPRKPVPSILKGAHFAVDQRELERREDVLVYTSDPLKAPLTVAGPVVVKLFAATDASDTDFVAKLLDVYPDGRAVKLGPVPAGVKRARYREGYDREKLLTSGSPQAYDIDLFDIAHTFLAGHRIRIDVSSSVAPYVNPNQNTGNPVATDTEWRIARQTIFHDRAHPSHVELSVLDGAR